MLTIPFALSAGSTDQMEKVTDLLEKTDIIASAPNAMTGLVDPYTNASGQDVKASQSTIALLQLQLQNEAAKNWELSFLRKWSPANVVEDGMEDFVWGPKHAFPSITVPETINPGPSPLFPEVFFSLYADQDLEVGGNTRLFGDLMLIRVDRADLLTPRLRRPP
ncbi:hypothetical protein MRB53_037097 [Persea americana]|nr:hypothetical protein MRB53_037097 [Persea americana]